MDHVGSKAVDGSPDRASHPGIPRHRGCALNTSQDTTRYELITVASQGFNVMPAAPQQRFFRGENRIFARWDGRTIEVMNQQDFHE
jgi:hypothetical protein